MYQGRGYWNRVIFVALTLSAAAGCRVPGQHFGNEALQLRFAQVTNSALAHAEIDRRTLPRNQPRRSAETRTLILAQK